MRALVLVFALFILQGCISVSYESYGGCNAACERARKAAAKRNFETFDTMPAYIHAQAMLRTVTAENGYLGPVVMSDAGRAVVVSDITDLAKGAAIALNSYLLKDPSVLTRQSPPFGDFLAKKLQPAAEQLGANPSLMTTLSAIIATSPPHRLRGPDGTFSEALSGVRGEATILRPEALSVAFEIDFREAGSRAASVGVRGGPSGGQVGRLAIDSRVVRSLLLGAIAAEFSAPVVEPRRLDGGGLPVITTEDGMMFAPFLTMIVDPSGQASDIRLSDPRLPEYVRSYFALYDELRADGGRGPGWGEGGLNLKYAPLSRINNRYWGSLLFYVMHEAHHVVLGHGKIDQPTCEVAKAQELAADQGAVTALAMLVYSAAGENTGGSSGIDAEQASGGALGVGHLSGIRSLFEYGFPMLNISADECYYPPIPVRRSFTARVWNYNMLEIWPAAVSVTQR